MIVKSKVILQSWSKEKWVRRDLLGLIQDQAELCCYLKCIYSGALVTQPIRLQEGGTPWSFHLLIWLKDGDSGTSRDQQQVGRPQSGEMAKQTRFT